jgi:hypothetical protein
METKANSKMIDTRKDFTTATFIHLSTLLKYFFPFANYIAPILIWTFNKERPFVDEHGRQAINFQLSMLVYTLLIGLGLIPFIIIFAGDIITIIQTVEYNGGDFTINNIRNLSGYALLFGLFVLLFITKFVFELYAVISASINASRGEHYKYPLSIPFIKTHSKSI